TTTCTISSACWRRSRERQALLRARLLLITSAAKNVGQRVIALVARVLVYPLGALGHRQHGGPGPGERRRIVHGELVAQRVRVDAREALDQVQRPARAAA